MQKINLRNYTEGSSEINACGQEQQLLDEAGISNRPTDYVCLLER